MNRKERRVYLARKKLTKVTLEARQNLENAIADLGDDCTHPLECIDTYRWTHDNGYGVLNDRVGTRCTLCGTKRAWSNDIQDWKKK